MFGRWSALDVVISIMAGSALGRAMTGGAPLAGTMIAAMVFLHVGWRIGPPATRLSRV